MNYDVFNGDADGILSLVQLRLADPIESTLVTGRKRDVTLLDRVDAKKGDRVTVLDVSMRSNAEDLRRILSAGAEVFYVDHHNAGEIPDHPLLTAKIDTSPVMCTAMLVDEQLEGKFRAWAVTAAFGDNFPELAISKGTGRDLPLESLARLGMLVNYNGYGGSIEDLRFHPEDLYTQLSGYETPMAFLAEQQDIYAELNSGYEDDLAMATNARVLNEADSGLALVLADSAASRRISGVFGNQLAQDNPTRAHAVLTAQEGGYLVSIRAPVSRRDGADTLALQFETGGGRSAAAGINHLPEGELDRFIQAFQNAF